MGVDGEETFVDDCLRTSFVELSFNGKSLLVVLVEDNSSTVAVGRSSILADLNGSLLIRLWSVRHCFVCKNENDDGFNWSIESFCSDDKSAVNDGDVIITIVVL